jgi:hypothetical protein
MEDEPKVRFLTEEEMKPLRARMRAADLERMTANLTKLAEA